MLSGSLVTGARVYEPLVALRSDQNVGGSNLTLESAPDGLKIAFRLPTETGDEPAAHRVAHKILATTFGDFGHTISLEIDPYGV